MVAIGMCLRSAALLAGIGAGLIGCATDEQLFARYDEAFCPVDGVAVATPLSARSQHLAGGVGAALKWVPIVYFDTDKHALSAAARQALDNNIASLRSDASYRVAVRGFADSSASDSYNRDLSRNRLTSVVRYLQQKGVDASRIIGSSHGETVPLAESESQSAAPINRRVELMLLDRDGRPVTVALPTDMLVKTK